MPTPDSHSSGFSPGRRWLTALNLFLATGAVLALVVMLNYLAAGHFKRFPLADATNFKLSPQTLAVLKSLTNDVTVTIFYQRKADVYTMISALLSEYQHASPDHVHVEDLDYDRSPELARNLRDRLHLSGPEQRDFVVFECKSNGQHKICYDNKLSNFNFNDLLQHREIRRTAFLGELYFTSAIFAVSHPADQKAYFLTGHGERNPGDPPAPNGSGCTNLASILKDEMNCDWKSLALSQTDSIPADCKLLIVASGSQPKGSLSTNELSQIQAYLKHGNGRLLALLSTTEGLDPVLKEWNVRLPEMHVIDKDPAVRIGDGDFLACPVVDKDGSFHPIMRPLVRDNLMIHMLAPHPIFPVNAAPGDPGAPTLTEVAATGRAGIQEPGEPVVRGTNGSPLPPRQYTLVAAIEQGVLNGQGGTRIVVAGDSDFLDDQMIDSTSANHYFARQTLDWLLQRPEALVGNIGPRPIVEWVLYMTQSQTTQLRWLFLAAMPGSVLFLGGLVWLRRRS
jgi:hypothetical protein